jgi:hypothetical protein
MDNPLGLSTLLPSSPPPHLSPPRLPPPRFPPSEAVVLATHSPINRNQLWVHDRQIPKRDYSVAIEVRPPGSLGNYRQRDGSRLGRTTRP